MLYYNSLITYYFNHKIVNYYNRSQDNLVDYTF